jgi:hypothetical protein
MHLMIFSQLWSFVRLMNIISFWLVYDAMGVILALVTGADLLE